MVIYNRTFVWLGLDSCLWEERRGVGEGRRERERERERERGGGGGEGGRGEKETINLDGLIICGIYSRIHVSVRKGSTNMKVIHPVMHFTFTVHRHTSWANFNHIHYQPTTSGKFQKGTILCYSVEHQS